MLHHVAIHWPDIADIELWPLAVLHAAHLLNRIPREDSGRSPLELFSRRTWAASKFQDFHVWGCPVYVLDSSLAGGRSKQASDFITVNDYLVRHIKMTYEMGRDIGKALEDLSLFDFTGVKPVLGISMESNEALRKAENRQYELDYNIDYKAHKYRVTKYKENLVKAYKFLWD